MATEPVSPLRFRVVSPEVEGARLYDPLPWYLHLYTLPFLSLYPVLAYAYYVKVR